MGFTSGLQNMWVEMSDLIVYGLGEPEVVMKLTHWHLNDVVVILNV